MTSNTDALAACLEVIDSTQRRVDVLLDELKRVRAKRDTAILDALDQGASLSQLGRVTGMKYQAIMKIRDRAGTQAHAVDQQEQSGTLELPETFYRIGRGKTIWKETDRWTSADGSPLVSLVCTANGGSVRTTVSPDRLVPVSEKGNPL